METLMSVAAWGFAFSVGWTVGSMLTRAVLNGIALGVHNWWKG